MTQNPTIKQYLEETEKEFDILMANLPKRVYETPKNVLRDFIERRQIGLIDLVKGLSLDIVENPDKNRRDAIEFLKNLEK